MGSLRSSLEMDNIMQQICYWAIHRNIWLTATHIPGKENIEADKESRKQEQRTEWVLNKKDLSYIASATLPTNSSRVGKLLGKMKQ